MFDGHTPQVISTCEGLYSRGNDDYCPQDHLLSAINVDYRKGDVRTRGGSVLDYTLPNIVRIQYFKKAGEATRVIILDSSGRLFDAAVSLVTPLITIPSMTDFSLYTYYNRAYITPHNGTTGLPGEKVYVYDGSTFRAAAGAAPSGIALLLSAGDSGVIEPGARFVAVAFETASGFITKPGPAVYGSGTFADSRKIVVGNIPIGPAGTVARHVLITAAIEPTGDVLNQNDYELFYAPNGRIADNSTTSLELDFYDSELVSSADDLIDQYEEIPAGVGFSDFNSRLAVYGIPGSIHTVILSAGGEPESISQVDGYCETDPKDSSGVKNCREIRGQLYIFKSLQTYTTQDNGDAPNTWRVTAVDKGLGAEPFGVADVLDAKGVTLDVALVANRNGLMLFSGSFAQTELTWKIENYWKRINKSYFSKVQVLHDSINHLIYCAVPLDSATSPDTLIVGYYSSELTPAGIRWSVWSFDKDPTSIAVDVDYSTLNVTFRYASAEGNVYRYSSTATNDNNVAFSSSVRFPFLPMLDDSGKVWQLGGIRSRIRGSGLLQISVASQDYASSQTLSGWNLALAPGQDYARQGNPNFQSERMSVQFSMTSINEYFILSRMVAFIKPVFAERPM